METVSEVQALFEIHSDEESERGSTKRPSILGWYRILRAHYHWPLFQAIRFALWLAR